MISIRALLFLVVAVACVLAFPGEEAGRVKKQVYYTGYPYSAYPYSAYAAAPLAYSAYSAYPAYSGYYY